MNLGELIKKLSYSNGNFSWKVGNSSGTVLTRSKLFTLLEKEGIINENEQNEAIELLKSLCTPKIKDLDIDQINPIIAKIKELNLYKDIIKYQNQGNDFPLVYFNNNGTLELLGMPSELTPEYLCGFLRNTTSSLRLTIDNNFKEFLITDKNPYPAAADVRKKVFMQYDIETEAPCVYLPDDLHPVTLDSVEYPSLKKISYTKTEGLKSDLNPMLIDLLDRISEHEYLCAIIYGALLGHHYPYMCYLYGPGGDGKTSFITMVGKLFNDSIVVKKQQSTTFSNSSIYGKGIIHISENTNPYIYGDPELLRISGGSLVHIERKGQDGFSGMIRGLIMIDSNVRPLLKGDPSESRRFRYFTVTKDPLITNDNAMNKILYANKLSSTPNEFLNYCRVQYEKLATDGSLIKNPPSLQSNLIKFKDSVTIYKIVEFINKYNINKNFSFAEGLTTKRGEVLFDFTSKNKEPYISAEFEKFLEREHGVITSGEYYINWGPNDGKDPKITKLFEGEEDE